MKGETHYSKTIPGTATNYNYSARFDWTGGYIGISQHVENDGLQRVLLSPRQVKFLLLFVEAKGERR